MHFIRPASPEPLLRNEVRTGLLVTHLRGLPLHFRNQINIHFVLSRLHYIVINIIDKTIWYTYITITTPPISVIDPLWFTSSSETIPSNPLQQRCPVSLKKYWRNPKVVPVYSTKANGAVLTYVVAQLILCLGTRGRWAESFTLRALNRRW